MQETEEAYVEITEYNVKNVTDFDDDGDLKLGWYFQIKRKSDDKDLTEMIGPYSNSEDCIEAAGTEWNEL